jgi:hypothetical protein
MAQKRRELVSTFVAGDATGRKVMVQYYRELVLQAAAPGQPDQWTPTGATTLVTEDGRDVKRKSKGVYEIMSVRGSSVLTSNDPDAP